MPKIPLSCCAALLAALACFAPAVRAQVELAVVDRDDGRLLPQYPHRGERWLAGVPGHRYAVRLTNASDERVLVVLSVDGVNAVTGEDADPSQAGYVLGPWQTAQIDGWRKSLDAVAGFFFTSLPDSYAARTGRPGNVGVIGIAVFREHRVPAVHFAPPPPWRRAPAGAGAREQRADAAAANADGDASRQRIGTGHGERIGAPVARTGFDRASRHPVQVTELRYDAPGRLAALGILPRGDRYSQPVAKVPRAFPGGFVPDP